MPDHASGDTSVPVRGDEGDAVGVNTGGGVTMPVDVDGCSVVPPVVDLLCDVVLMGCSPQYCIGRVDRVIGPTSQTPRAPFGIWALQFYSGDFSLGYHSRIYACIKPRC
jgi:hypothetical protein